ncbi:MAG: hypothetical protein AB1513_08070 [Pseudomonadota bacterium]
MEKILSFQGGATYGMPVMLYGLAGLACGGLIADHAIMQNVCYGMMAFGLICGAYLLAIRHEVMSVPTVVCGLLYGSGSLLVHHDTMAELCFTLGIVSCINGAMMFAMSHQAEAAATPVSGIPTTAS